MATLENAISLAAISHEGQTDRAGQPYILHPMRVMMSLGREATTEERCAAIMHDIVEDCDVTFDDLLDLGFSEDVVRAIDALTKRPEEKDDYMKAIRRLSSNPIARRVKLGDLADNLDLSRLPSPTERDIARMEKYREAKKFLEEIESSS
ncbi:HD domain-containing protein [bacterium]|nr:MAG: HD domain-containing protein [bacterium]